MKAVITMDPITKAGILKVMAETPIESFALHHWWRNWSEGDGGDSSSLFAVETGLPSEEVGHD